MLLLIIYKNVVELGLSVGKKIQAGIKTQIYKYDLKNNACPNPNCSLDGNVAESKVIANDTYRTKEGILSHRFFCNKCGKPFCSRTGNLFYGLRTTEEKILMGLKLLAKGMPSLSVSKTLGVRHDTLQRWLSVAVTQNRKIDTMLLKNLKVYG